MAAATEESPNETGGGAVLRLGAASGEGSGDEFQQVGGPDEPWGPSDDVPLDGTASFEIVVTRMADHPRSEAHRCQVMISRRQIEAVNRRLVAEGKGPLFLRWSALPVDIEGVRRAGAPWGHKVALRFFRH